MAERGPVTASMVEAEAADRIRERLLTVQQRIGEAAERAGRDPCAVTLVAVSKTQPAEHVRAAVAAGQLVFGENRLDEALPKMQALADLAGVTWHMIGHVQSRKAHATAETGFGLIHSVDTLKLAERLGRTAEEAGRQQAVLLEMNVSGEASKAGFRAEQRDQWSALRLELKQAAQLPGLAVRGLMTMAPAVADPAQARLYFDRLRELLDYLAEEIAFGPGPVLSMGMSDDFEAAIASGATMVRVGRAIFGERD